LILQSNKVLADRFESKMETKKNADYKENASVYLMPPKLFPTPSFSSLELFIGQASS